MKETKMLYDEYIENWTDIDVWNRDKTVMLSWEWLGEGKSGDYLTFDKEDYPHLRFSIYRKGRGFEAEAVDNASYCTTLSIVTPKETLEKLAIYILNIVENRVKGNRSIKKLCEELSWIDEGVLCLPE